jgi:aspartokinase-like uncharacterized kinase
MDTDRNGARESERERAKRLVRSILAEDFKQNADDAVVDDVAEKILKALNLRNGHST